MKCAWKEAHDKQRLTDVCENFGTLWLAYIESLAENVAVDVFGVGRRKLSQMRNETADDLNEYMNRYADNVGDVWETTQDAEFGLIRELCEIGVDIRLINRGIPIPDNHADTWHSPQEMERYKWRRNYVDTMDTKQNVYWAVMLLWWHGEGYGALRLNRYYTEVRRRYVRFAEHFIRYREGWRMKMERMVAEEQKRLSDRGVEFEAVKTEAMREGRMLPVSDKWLENLRYISRSENQNKRS